MRYFQKLLCLLILVLAASFGVGGCVLLYSDFSVQRSRMAAANAAAHAQACTLLQTEILDLQRRGISTEDAALTARVTAQNVPAALWRGDTLVCATLEGLQGFPLGDAATVTVRTENSIYAVYASDLQGGLRLVTAYDLTGLYRDRNAALMRFLLLEAAVLAAASAQAGLESLGDWAAPADSPYGCALYSANGGALITASTHPYTYQDYVGTAPVLSDRWYYSLTLQLRTEDQLPG